MSQQDIQKFKELFLDATINGLQANRKLLDELNVFPVPDGDTGSNMLMTVSYVRNSEEVTTDKNDDLAATAQVIHRNVLLGAHGNSGLLVSHLFKGLHQAIEDTNTFDGAVFAQALSIASRTATEAIPDPKEGTILTVYREASEAAARAAQASANLETVLASTVDAAIDTVRRTPEMLQVLRDAGVVDSGGLGVAIMLKSALIKLRGEGDGSFDAGTDGFTMPEGNLVAGEYEHHDNWGYCVNFAIIGEQLDKTKIQRRISRHGKSLVLVSEGDIAKIHIHSENPGKVLSAAIKLGALTQVEIDNMNIQTEQVAKNAATNTNDATDTGLSCGIVTVASGEGMLQVYREMADPRALSVIDGGALMNPSTAQFKEALENMKLKHIIVLPNNKNSIPIANAAVELIQDKQIEVLPTKSMITGLTALLSFFPFTDQASNIRKIKASIKETISGSVFQTSRAVTTKRIRAKANDYLATVDDKIIASGDNALIALERALGELARQAINVVIYTKNLPQKDEFAELEQYLRSKITNLESLELLYGGQPNYNYLFSVAT